MNFRDVIYSKNPQKPLFINENDILLYADVLKPEIPDSNGIVKISSQSPPQQLKRAYCLSGQCVPFIIPENLINENIELKYDNADFAVATSGTTAGKSKYYFRTVKSWADFFPVQNRLFGIDENTVIFVQGSMCYTGNFNMMSGVAFSGATAVSSLSLRAERWAEQILKYNADTVYLVPEKLLHLCRAKTVFENVKTIICGSQLVTINDYKIIKESFPNAHIVLYYGSSEVSYVSYNILDDVPAADNCIGKIFDGIEVKIADNGHIIVKSPYLVCGAESPCDTGDVGYMDNDGLLYFIKRSNNN